MSLSCVQRRSLLLPFIVILLLLSCSLPVMAASKNQNIYDNAHLLTEKEVMDLESLSSKLGKERDTSFIIITLNSLEGKDIIQYVEDFYDEMAPGYDQPHGNTAILAIDMAERDVYLAGFKKAEKYLDSGRLDQIRGIITPSLSEGNYFQAFSSFIQTSHDYMGYEPGVNPENILFKWWFQVIISLLVAGIVVALIAYRSGGRVTVNARTYMNTNHSGVLNQHDHFIRQTVTRQKRPTDNSQSGGGGGMTSGGHSHSGSKGKF